MITSSLSIQRPTVKLWITCVKSYKTHIVRWWGLDCLYSWQCLLAYSCAYSNALGKIWLVNVWLSSFQPRSGTQCLLFVSAHEELAKTQDFDDDKGVTLQLSVKKWLKSQVADIYDDWIQKLVKWYNYLNLYWDHIKNNLKL